MRTCCFQVIALAALEPKRIFSWTISALLPIPIGRTSRSRTACSALSTQPSSGSSTGGTSDDTSLGRILEGGQIIDFSSVKASSRAENALSDARKRVERQLQDTNHEVLHTSILGINKQVIDEVGHELGRFATADEIQECAHYLLSKSDPAALNAGIFVEKNFSDAEIRRYEQILDQAYTEAGEVTSAFAKTFYMGTMLLAEEARKSIWAVYVWCRRTDEIVDAPRDSNDSLISDLSCWELRLENLWNSGCVVDVYDLCLLDLRLKYPGADIQPYLDMIRGMLMDVPGLGQERYETFDDLHLYCYRVAGTVGLMSLPVFGCAKEFNMNVAR